MGAAHPSCLCVVHSNFPGDALSFGYRTFWNAARKMAARYLAEERDLMLRLTKQSHAPGPAGGRIAGKTVASGQCGVIPTNGLRRRLKA